MKDTKFLLYCLLFFGLSSCKGPMEPSDYLSWASDEANGLRKSKTIKGIQFELQYKPIEYIIAKESKGQTISEKAYQKRKKELDGMHYFDLRIHPPQGQGSIMQYGLNQASENSNRINYFSFGMKNDLFLESSLGKSPCKLFHFERSFDMAPHRTFVLAFPKSNPPENEFTFIFDSPEFKTGPIKIHFPENRLSNLPKIALN